MSQKIPKRPRSPEREARVRQKAVARSKQREKMLIAAAQLFCKRGFDKTGVDEITACLKLKKPRFYVHFKNKQQILKDCIDRALRQWRDAIQQLQTDPLQSGAEAVRLIVERYADVAFGDFGMCLMSGDVEYLTAEQHKILIRQKTEIDVGFVTLIAQTTPRKSRLSSDPEFLWSILAVLVHGVAMSALPLEEKRRTLSNAVAIILAGANSKT